MNNNIWLTGWQKGLIGSAFLLIQINGGCVKVIPMLSLGFPKN